MLALYLDGRMEYVRLRGRFLISSLGRLGHSARAFLQAVKWLLGILHMARRAPGGNECETRFKGFVLKVPLK